MTLGSRLSLPGGLPSAAAGSLVTVGEGEVAHPLGLTGTGRGGRSAGDLPAQLSPPRAASSVPVPGRAVDLCGAGCSTRMRVPSRPRSCPRPRPHEPCPFLCKRDLLPRGSEGRGPARVLCGADVRWGDGRGARRGWSTPDTARRGSCGKGRSLRFAAHPCPGTDPPARRHTNVGPGWKRLSV